MRVTITRGRKSYHHEDRDAALAWVPWQWGISLEQLGPATLFTVCEVEERRFKAINGKQFLKSLDRMRLFEGPVFSEQRASRARKAHEFGLLITPPRGAKSEWKYTELVRKLKKLHETDLRWLLIARWLEREGVCRAEEFLPKEILERLLKRAKKARLRVSANDLQMARLVRIWIPYFERLLRDRDKLLKKRRRIGDALNELSKMGYLESAVESIYGKREPVPAVVNWLTLRKEAYPADERTLLNAHSRVETAKRKTEAIESRII